MDSYSFMRQYLLIVVVTVCRRGTFPNIRNWGNNWNSQAQAWTKTKHTHSTPGGNQLWPFNTHPFIIAGWTLDGWMDGWGGLSCSLMHVVGHSDKHIWICVVGNLFHTNPWQSGVLPPRATQFRWSTAYSTTPPARGKKDGLSVGRSPPLLLLPRVTILFMLNLVGWEIDKLLSLGLIYWEFSFAPARINDPKGRLGNTVALCLFFGPASHPLNHTQHKILPRILFIPIHSLGWEGDHTWMAGSFTYC